MQNRYVGDIGDFGKYGLLQVLCDGSPSLKLGVIWYLYKPRNENPRDGDKINYLEPTKYNQRQFAECNNKLYEKLRAIVDGKRRSVSAIREERILPPSTVFYEEKLAFDEPFLLPKNEKEALRKRWLEGAEKKTEGCNVIFLDPDNGLEVKSVRPYYKKGPKYVFREEIKPYVERSQSVILYQHLNRQGKAPEQIHRRFKQFEELPRVFDIFALQYHRGTGRVFFVLASRKHSKILRAQTDRLLEGLWAKHFQLING